MVRLDFHSVSNILMANQKNADISQIDFMYQLFAAFMNDESTNFDFDNGLVCHWLKGEVRVSPKIISYYIPEIHHQSMHDDMINEVFPFISDPASVTFLIKELLITDVSISENERQRLLGFLSDDTSECYAAFIAETLIFGMSRCFVNSGNGTRNSSPLIDDIILTTNLPIPIHTFVDCETEMTNIEELLSANPLVFLTGIPGIGKSEIAKTYMKTHKKYYTNILYLEYTGSLHDNVLLPNNQNKLSISKDNVTVKSEYQNNMQNLLQYDVLAPALQQTYPS